MPNWMKYNHVKKMATVAKPEQEPIVRGPKCHTCARWTPWSPGDTHPGVCHDQGRRWATDGHTPACNAYARRP